ncbi:MAG TPA: ABC transporter ATP-binding protein [Armatimonadota bacterium]|nr:ABC transporter ATP-binding protein [Armatimonadota bacterium]
MVTARGLTKEYPLSRTVKIRALDGLDLDIDYGCMVAIMGPSGSGKSTLLNLLGCLDTPDDGELLIDGIDVRANPRPDLADIRLRRIGFVFQRFNLLEHLTALENVALPLGYSWPRIPPEERLRRAEQALGLVGLSHRLHHRPDQLSGGEQQRVGIARATINNPKLILADEPTGELDSVTSRQVVDLLHGLVVEQGCTVAVVTHDGSIAERADWVARMVDGRVDTMTRR